MKTHIAKRMVFCILALVLLLVSLVLILPRVINLDDYRAPVIEEIQAITGGDVKLQSITWGFTQGLWVKLETLSVTNAGLMPMDFYASQVYVKIALMPLLHGSLVIKSVSLLQPHLTYRLEATAAENETPVLPPQDKSSDLSLDIALAQLSIREGRITLLDSLTIPGQTQQFELHDVELKITNLKPGSVMHYALSLKQHSKKSASSATLSLQGTFEGLSPAFTLANPKLSLEARLMALDIGPFSAYFNNAELANKLAGSVSATLVYNGDLGDNGTVTGDIDLGKFSYTDTTLWPQPVPGLPTTLHYALAFEPSVLFVQALTLKLGELSLQGSAIIQDWQGDAVMENIAFSGKLPLVAMAPIIPWQILVKHDDAQDQSALVHDLLSGGGEIIVEKLTLPALAISQWGAIKKSPDTLLAGIELSLRINNISVKAAKNLPRVKMLSAHIQLEHSMLKAENIHAVMGPIIIPPLSVTISDLLTAPKVTASAKGKLILADKPDKDIAALLDKINLDKVIAEADVDIQAHYQHAEPAQWQAGGSIIIKKLNVSTRNANATASLHGRIEIKKQQQLNIPAIQLQGLINESPVSLSGNVAGLAEPEMSAKLHLNMDALDLSVLDKFVSDLKPYALEGLLHTDVAIHYQHHDALNTDLNGSLRLEGLALTVPEIELNIRQAKADIALTPGAIKLKSLQLLANDQALLMSGNIRDITAPKIDLNIYSEHLNIDRLFPAIAEEKHSSATAEAQDEAADKNRPAQLPDIVQKASLVLALNVAKGQYQKQTFEHLLINSRYANSNVEHYDVALNAAGGTIKVTGSADLNDLDRIAFVVDHDVKSVNIEEIMPLLTEGDVFMSGPLTTSGHLQGQTGHQLKQSLRGTLSLHAGPGSIPQEGTAGGALLKLLSVLDIEGLFKEGLTDKLSGSGKTYRSMVLESDFIKKGMHITLLEVNMAAFDAEAKGLVSLAENTINMDIIVTLLAALDKTLAYVPLIGSAVADVTKVYLTVSGPLDDPKVRVKPIAGIHKGVKKIIQTPGKGIKKGFNALKEVF
ncbi:MAG: AsmA-like C-terminal domain-containing protein [Pseudomonadales bacterium]|nr:AsmA-like C-terminal domain-containing protein [Pseudomonadales bacterium]